MAAMEYVELPARCSRQIKSHQIRPKNLKEVRNPRHCLLLWALLAPSLLVGSIYLQIAHGSTWVLVELSTSGCVFLNYSRQITTNTRGVVSLISVLIPDFHSIIRFFHTFICWNIVPVASVTGSSRIYSPPGRGNFCIETNMNHYCL